MKKILIVEDNQINLELMIQLLEEDFDLSTADNGAEALAAALLDTPDLIFMDMSLPVMDGWESTRRIKADPRLRDIPIIGLSAHAMSGDAEKALAAGCDDYLTKPINVQLLFDKLEAYLK